MNRGRAQDRTVRALASIAPGAGTYILLLRARRAGTVEIGRLGELALEPGWYAYVGSALGPGGVRARLAHHVRIAPRPHWHVDHLRRHAELAELWWQVGPSRAEHDWAALLARSRGASIPMPRFGASDCRCPAHLVRFDRRPPVEAFRRLLRRASPGLSTVERLVL